MQSNARIKVILRPCDCSLIALPDVFLRRKSNKFIKKEVEFNATDDFKLYGTLEVPENTQSNKCVVLCHGLAVDREDLGVFTKLATKLVDEGFHIFRFDFRDGTVSVMVLYFILVGPPRFELGLKRPKRLVLPLHHGPLSVAVPPL